MADIENGCLGIWEQQTDYLLCEWFEDALPTLYDQDNVIFEYNQSNQAWSKKSCTIFSAVWAISDLFNYEFSLDEIKEIDDRSYSLWRFPNSWWWVQSAVKLVADRWNENETLVKKYWKVAYYKIAITNKYLVSKILDKWYNIMTNINGNTKDQLDYLKDAIVNDTEFGGATYGHALNLVTVNLKKIWGKVCVKDNYKGRTTNNGKMDCNIYALEHYPNEISVFWTNWYIYTKVKEDALEEVKRLNTLKTECNNCITQLWTIWHLVNDENFKSILHYTADKLRGKINDCDEQLKKYE